ncbi:MAG: type II toxin-antitoxin system VapC family toxin [Pirellulales bacterium]|nr:type II toxin-antitoxin system VapC family toxin [Pirellulales bacterium]
MSTILADTSFFVAYLNPREDCHPMAVEWMTASSERMVTTEWVLAELGNYLAEGPNRRLFGSLVRALSAEKRVEIVAADHESFLDALGLYVRRPDQSWSFTDCASFRLMKARKITEALTTDHHFEQAGFKALLR